MVDSCGKAECAVYFGLVQLAAGALDLTWWITPVGHTDIRLGWVGLAAAIVGLLLAMTAAAMRGGGISDFYRRPCWGGAILLTGLASIVGSMLAFSVAKRSALASYPCHECGGHLAGAR